MNLASASIRRPVFAAMIVLGLVTLGIVSLTKLEIELNPDVDFPIVQVATVLRGASPETIETEVTDILEEEINTIEGTRTLRSISSQGLSQIIVEFELGHESEIKAQEVREKVAIARPRLPLDVEDPVVVQFDPDAVPIMEIMLGGPVSIRELSDFADHVVAERLERLAGVGSVRVVGARKREIRIWLDPLRLTGYGLAIGDVARTLRQENAELAGGRIEGPEREWSVTTQGKVRRVEDFGALIVAQRGGRLVYLRDVGVIEDGLEEERSIARLNGQRGVSLQLRRQSGANTVAVARRVRAELEDIRPSAPPGVTLTLARDNARFIEASIRAIFTDMIWGGFLAVMIVLLFLRNNRSTLIASLAIPSSVIGSFTLFYIAGFSLNTMSLVALTLSIGLVIDDAIVVLENIYRRMEGGESRMAAADKGASQVGLPVIATTGSVCAVFVPIAFMEGMVGQWFYEFGLVVVITVCISLLVAFTLTPMVASRILRVNANPGWFYASLERAFRALETGYARLLGGAVRHKGMTVAVALVAVVGGCAIGRTLDFGFYQEGDRSEFTVRAKLPIGTPLAVTGRVTRKIESLIAEHPHVHTVFSTAGGGYRHAPHEASVFIGITDKTERSETQNEIMSELRERLVANVPEAEEIEVNNIAWVSMNARQALLQYTLRGPELHRLEGYADGMLARMRADPTLVDVSSSHEAGKPEITLDIDRDVAADLGVPAVSAGYTIRALLAGEKVGSYEEAGRRHDVRIQVLPQYRDDPSQLDLIRVRSLRGELVPLTNVVHRRVGEGAVEIHRENRARQITLYANMADGKAMGIGTTKIEAWGREIGIASPDELVPSGRVRAMAETFVSLTLAFLLALAAIYMILASLYNSLTHPFVIMMSAPLSFIGAALALKLAGMSIDLMSGIGLLVLMGLVMKNGILLVDYANQFRAAGRGREEAALEAGRVRMRPVLMTTGALVFGMAPLAFGVGLDSEFRAPIGMISVGGLITSTLLTLVVVPVVYCLIDSASEYTRTRLAALVSRRTAEPPAASTS
jgi:HAE1 family hydrophobic/amphiphilic exporter-1